MKNKLAYFKNFNKLYYTTDGYDDYLERFEKEGFRPLGKLFKPGKKLTLSPFEKIDFNYVFKKN